MPKNHYEKVKVNEVEVDFVALKLLIQNQWHDIEARQLNLLKLLIENHGRAVSRNEIMNDIWHDTIVSDNSVSQAITQLRKSLHDDKETPRFIRTVPRVGYQLIADIEFPKITEPQKKLVKQNKRTNIVVAAISALVTIALSAIFIAVSTPSLVAPSYRYESRLTSTPGPENFLRFSPQGRYLAFSQISDDRLQMDLAIYDSQTQSVHTIKNTGYSEEAAEWSPDKKWLIYFRHDPISCEIRVMAIHNPIETWRISPDRHLAYCTPGFSKQKMHWLADNTIFMQAWHENKPILQRLDLEMDGYPSVKNIKQFPHIHPELMDIDKQTKQMLIVEKYQHQFQLKLVNLATFKTSILEKQEQEYWGLKWHKSNESYWLGNESLKLVSINKNQETVYMPMGFIPDLDLNPITQKLAHTEGVANVNLYTLEIPQFTQINIAQGKQLSSSARTDILPTLSEDGIQTAFISYQRRSMDGLRHAEIWLKNKYKKTASLLVNLKENIRPKYLLWSPNGENLILGDNQYNLYLINVFSKHMVPIISDYTSVDEVNWSKDGKYINFSTTDKKTKQHWQYNLQLTNTKLLSESKSLNSQQDKISTEMVKKINPSFRQYLSILETYLTDKLQGNTPVDNLIPSFRLYRPFVFEKGIYYVIKQGHQLTLYCYLFDKNKNIQVSNIGNHEQDIYLQLSISASKSGEQLVFSKLEGLETDILVQSKINQDE